MLIEAGLQWSTGGSSPPPQCWTDARLPAHNQPCQFHILAHLSRYSPAGRMVFKYNHVYKSQTLWSSPYWRDLLQLFYYIIHFTSAETNLVIHFPQHDTSEHVGGPSCILTALSAVDKVLSMCVLPRILCRWQLYCIQSLKPKAEGWTQTQCWGPPQHSSGTQGHHHKWK